MLTTKLIDRKEIFLKKYHLPLEENKEIYSVHSILVDSIASVRTGKFILTRVSLGLINN